MKNRTPRADFGGKASEVSNYLVVQVLCRRHTNELDNDFAILLSSWHPNMRIYRFFVPA